MKKSLLAVVFLFAATVLFAEGNFNLKFGAEFWSPVSPIIVADNPSANNKKTDPLDSFKVYLGVTYFLPLK